MNATSPGTRTNVDLLELARTVEQCVPADVERAQASLRSLSDAVRVEHEQPRNATARSPLDPPNDAERLRRLLARIMHDLAGGHVLAVNGLERQLKYYLEHSSST